MPRKLTSLIAATALFVTGIAPGIAHAHDSDRYWRGDRHYSDHYRHRRHRDDDGEAIVAGALGLALGLAVGSMLAQPRNEVRCYDNYQRCPPPRGYQNQGYDDGRPYDDGYYDDGYAPAPYARGADACIRPVEQWDPYAGRYVWVNLRVPC